MSQTTNHDAARLLGMKTSEIASVEDTDAGVVIGTTDGVYTIVVPEDHPDAEGKTGPMYYGAPSNPYRGSAPVYAAPKRPAKAEPTVAEPAKGRRA